MGSSNSGACGSDRGFAPNTSVDRRWQRANSGRGDPARRWV